MPKKDHIDLIAVLFVLLVWLLPTLTVHGSSKQTGDTAVRSTTYATPGVQKSNSLPE